MHTFIYNLTQHPATPEQRGMGVRDLTPKSRREVMELLTFEHVPTHAEMRQRARRIAMILRRFQTAGTGAAMIGGAPFFMPILQTILQEYGVDVCYAFSQRQSVEETLPNGDVKKTQTFRHTGFIPATRLVWA